MPLNIFPRSEQVDLRAMRLSSRLVVWESEMMAGNALR
jgi:hypothetical protein